MVRQVETELERQGSRVQRVVLDDELKGSAYRAFQEVRSHGEPDRYARLAVAEAQGLHVERDHFVFPDVRLEVQDRDGTERTVDLELVTKDYHRGHLSGKAGAGFRMFSSGSGGSRGGTPKDQHNVREAAPMIATDARCRVLEMLGYTPRQAQLLVLVALHGGYFLRRQYVAFTGTPHGQAAVRFLAQCVAREHVRTLPYGRQGHLYHLYSRPLYATLGEEDNRNRRPAEWDAVIRKLMTLDFVLAQPTARFLATEEEKVALLRERSIPSVVWPHRNYAPRRPNGRTTTRYFVDKMPWYQDDEDDRIWIAYVDAERTLQGFETFLDQYRALLSSMMSGVTYVAPTVWHGVIQNAFAKALESYDRGIMSRFSEYCQFRRAIEVAHSNASLTPDQRLRYRERCGEFLTPAFDAVYRKFLETSSISSTDVDAAVFPPCQLRVHALGRRYDPQRATEAPPTTEEK